MGSTVKKRQFSLEEMKNLISKVDKGLKKDKVANKYGISPSTLSTILKNRKRIMKQLQNSVWKAVIQKIKNVLLKNVHLFIATIV